MLLSYKTETHSYKFTILFFTCVTGECGKHLNLHRSLSPRENMPAEKIAFSLDLKCFVDAKIELI